MKDYKNYRATNNLRLIADGMEMRLPNVHDLDNKLRMKVWQHNLRNYETRPNNKIIGLAKRAWTWMKLKI